MKMKSTCNNFKNKGFTYPFLGVYSDGTVVLFSSYDKGTIVHCGRNEDRDVGYYCSTWNTDKAVPFNGSITLEN